MKVIGIDNYGRDYNGGKDEEVAGENLTLEEARALCTRLNVGPSGAYKPVFYVMRSDDYTPYKFEGY